MALKMAHGGALPAAILALLIASGPAQADDAIPAWAFPMQPPRPDGTPAPPRPAPDPTLRTVPGSKLSMTYLQAQDSLNAPDWHPEDHPTPPDVILHGHPPHLEACAHCHLPNGVGTTIIQAPGLAGLSAEYMLQQMVDIKSGARKSAVEKWGGTRTMAFVLKEADDADLKTAAEYFASLAPKPWFRVVETANVPASKISGLTYLAEGSGFEPIDGRIIELPEDKSRYEMRDGRSGFVAYVPPGSIKKGEALVKTGGKDTTIPCTSCHGPDLRGLGPVPALAGRSPSYIVRQLIDLQHGARAGVWSALMKPVVAKLTTADMTAIAAYVASREP